MTEFVDWLYRVGVYGFALAGLVGGLFWLSRPDADGRRWAAKARNNYYGYWLVAVAFLAQFISVGSQNYMIGSFTRPMTEELDWSRSEFVLARSIGQFIMAFTGFFIGGYVDRHGGAKLMRVGVFILAGATFLCGYVQELWQWWVLNGLVVTTGAAMIGNLVVNVTLSKWFVEKRGRVASFAAMGVSYAGVALTPLSATLVDAVGWRTAWHVLAVGVLAVMFPLSFAMRRAPEDYGLHPDGKTPEQIAAGGGRAAAADFALSMTRQQALRTTAFYFIVFGFGLGAVSIGVMLVQTVPFMEDAGYSRKVGAGMILLTSIPSLLSKPVWGWMIDRADAQRLSLIGFTINAVSLVVIVLTVRNHADLGVVVGFFLLGLGWGGLIPLQEVVWASYFGRRYLGAVRSAGLPFSLIIGASSPFLTSFYFDKVGNYDGAFFAVAALALVAVVLVSLAKQPKSRREGQPSTGVAAAG
ncbi:MAG: MFS transporter [Dehalococcoidia bacterium]|nr:MAG: MFS transporter [Dehalococcoidia bacterium]